MRHDLIKAKRKAEDLFQQMRLAEAKAAFRKICKAAPNDADARLNYGAVSGLLGEFPEAEAAFRRVLEINPHLPQAYFNLGKLLVLLGRMHEAEAYWRTYVGLVPDLAEGQYQLAKILMNMGRTAESLGFYREALRLGPNSLETLLDYGNALQILGRFDEAEAALRQALTLNPAYANTYLKLAYHYCLRRQFEKSANALQQVLAIDPGLRGTVLRQSATNAIWQGKFAEAAAYFNEGYRLQPDDVELRWERSLHLLRMGHYREGWREYEARTRYWRWLDVMNAYNFSQARWAGEPSAGRTILVYAEQGFGDTIQCSRYLPLLAARGAKVLFYCQEELLSLFRRMKGIDRVEPRSEKVLSEKFDVHAPIMSLPHLFDTRLETIPAQIPYLEADPELVSCWRAHIDAKQFTVGLVWAGRSSHVDNYWRSLSAQDLAPLAAAESAKFYSLQKDADETQFRLLAASLNIEDLSPQLHDFGDTAAAISNLDLVITVDTAVAHLAAALGRPTWILLHFPPDWRWLTERGDSPWYPTVRLFRREMDEEWKAVMQRVASALSELSAAGVHELQ